MPAKNTARERPARGRPTVAPETPAVAFDPTPMRRPLLAWYRRTRRDLPWRRTRDPYRIWVSEILLQQTRVDVVVPFYERFLAQFPDIATLAAAPRESVLQAWAGLGYYARARNLHAAAQQIVAAHGGRFPEDADAVRGLPGIGPYTAGAIRSIAFGAAAPILDGNVVRVFARWFGLDGDVDSPVLRRDMWATAARWAEGSDPGDANQALMELGATVCTKPIPRCEICPVEALCAARRTGRECTLPRARARPAPRTVRLEAGWVQRRGRVLLVRRSGGKLLQDWWELPSSSAAKRGAPPGARLAAALHERLGLESATPRRVTEVRHAILEHRIEASLFAIEAAGGSDDGVRRASSAARPARRGSIASLDHPAIEMRWIRRDELAVLPLSTLTRKLLGAMECEKKTSGRNGRS
jgi:A/G-specific adenine glycosylase